MNDGNIYEVEVRGERHEDKIRFKGKDVEKVFQMDGEIKVLVFTLITPRGYKLCLRSRSSSRRASSL